LKRELGWMSGEVMWGLQWSFYVIGYISVVVVKGTCVRYFRGLWLHKVDKVGQSPGSECV
jgi:hypothetical protein